MQRESAFPQRLERYLDRLANVPDPRIAIWAIGSDGPDPRLALLAGCLLQDLEIPAAVRLVHDLRMRLGDTLLEPWTIRVESLESACALPWLAAWPHRASLAGWISALGDILREHPDPSVWSTTWEDPRDLVRLLASRVPWMGRKSSDRVKGWRIARWLVRGEGLAAPLWPSEARTLLVVPSPVVATPLGWFGLLPPSWESHTPRMRQEWTDSVIQPLRPLDPASAWIPLETILRRGRADSRCAELQEGGCSDCPLAKECKGERRTAG